MLYVVAKPGASRVVFAGVMVLAWLPAVAGPAQAYSPNPTVYWVAQHAETCLEIGGNYPAGQFELTNPTNIGCRVIGTRLQHNFNVDENSRNLVAELGFVGVGLKAVVSFEAYDERLFVADTSNDSDTIYVWIAGEGPYTVTGSSDELDTATFDLSLTDGVSHTIRITDDRAGNDVIAQSGSGLPFLVP